MRQIQVTIFDDLDGPALTPAVITDLPFFYRGNWYQVDLGEANLKLYTELMESMLLKGRACDEMPKHHSGIMLDEPGVDVTETPKMALSNAQKAARTKQLKPIREWVNANGWDISPYGIIPQKAMQAYYDAHPGEGE